jgi:hypothetical protein
MRIKTNAIVIKKYFLLLFCLLCSLPARSETVAKDKTDSLEAEKTQLIRQWEMPFVHLKSLQLSVKDFVTQENGKPVARRMILSGTFSYDDPKFLDDVIVKADDYTRTWSKGDQEAKASYDGYYYYNSSTGYQESKVPIVMRAKDMDETWPPVTLNPLALTFWFVLNGTDAANFKSLTNPRTWDAFAERVTDFQKNPETGEITFGCKSYNAKNKVTHTYEIKAVMVDGMYFPVSVKDFTREDKTIYSESVISQTIDTKSTFGLPVPAQIKSSVYEKGILISEITSETDVASLQINKPVDDAIFNLAPPGVKILDIPVLSLKEDER